MFGMSLTLAQGPTAQVVLGFQEFEETPNMGKTSQQHFFTYHFSVKLIAAVDTCAQRRGK